MGRLRTSLLMEYHEESPHPGGPPDAPGAPIRTRCLVRLCRGRHRLHRLFPVPIPPHPHFPVPHSLDRHRQGMCHRLVLVVSTQMIRPRRSRGQSWDRRWCCCLVSQLGRRIPLLRTDDFPGLMNPLLRRLHRHRFQVCLSLREISLFSKRHFRHPPRNLLYLQMVRIRIRTRPSTIVGFLAGDDDALIRLPTSFAVPSFVPLDGDGFASWLTKQDKIKAGTITQEMQRKYAKEKFVLLSWRSSRVTWTMTPSGLLTVVS